MAYRERIESALDLLGRACVWCRRVETLEFDHIRASTKLFEITQPEGRSAPDPIFWAEVAKCQLLCHACHLVKTTRERGYHDPFTHGTRSMYQKHKCRCTECRAWNARRGKAQRASRHQ